MKEERGQEKAIVNEWQEKSVLEAKKRVKLQE